MRKEKMTDELRKILRLWFGIFRDLESEKELEDQPIWKDWRNPNPENEPNSILESEMMLTFLLPQDWLPEWTLHPRNPSRALRDFLSEQTNYESYTDQLDFILKIILAHFKRMAPEGKQIFSTPEYLAPKSDLKTASMVDAFSLAVTVSLIAKRLAKRIIDDRTARQNQRPNDTTKLSIEIRKHADARLSEALKGLLASFAVNVKTWDVWHQGGKSRESPWSWPGRENESLTSNSTSAQELARVKQKLQTLGFNIGDADAFECGWSWGPVSRAEDEWNNLFGANQADRASGNKLWNAVPEFAENQKMLAENAPYLYFTTIALDGIDDVISPDNYSTGLLEDDQVVYASRLQALASAARQYWAALATAPAGDKYHKHLVELVPWKTADDKASVYWNIFVMRICSSMQKEGEISFDRQFNLIERLAENGLILREPIPAESDTALNLHWPGIKIDLNYQINGKYKASEANSAEIGESECSVNEWVVYDYTPQLLKLGVKSASEESNHKKVIAWNKLLNVIWISLEDRKDRTSPLCSSWDRIDALFPAYVDRLKKDKLIGELGGLKSFPWPDPEFEQGARSAEKKTVTSWYFTERVVEAIVAFLSYQGRDTDEFPYLERTTAELLAGLRDRLPDDDIERVEREVEEQPAEAFRDLLNQLRKMHSRD